MKKFLVFLSAIVFVFGIAGAASAVPVTWNIVDGIFEDGGTVSGSFVFDDDASAVSDWDISVTAAGSWTAFTFDIGNSNANPSSYFDKIVFNSNAVFGPYSNGWRSLRLGPLADLTNSGGTVALSGYECINCYPARSITGGSLVSAAPVPEPGTMLLLGSGLIGLVAFRKKFKK